MEQRRRRKRRFHPQMNGVSSLGTFQLGRGHFPYHALVKHWE